MKKKKVFLNAIKAMYIAKTCLLSILPAVNADSASVGMILTYETKSPQFHELRNISAIWIEI